MVSQRSSPVAGRPTRRHFLVTMVAATLGGLSGCLRGEDRPAAIALDGEKYCDQCGMLIEAQPGPVGQTFFEEFSPAQRDGPAWFCSGVCTYNYTFERRDEGRAVVVIYLTDYARVDWQTSSEDGQTYLSAHLEAEWFTDADDLVLVVGSELVGAMGPDLVGFSDRDAAASFAGDYGGELYDHDDVTPELVGSLSG